MTVKRILFLPPAAGMIAEWRTLDADGHRLQSGRLLPDDPAFDDDIPTVAVVPGADVAVRWLDLPRGSSAQAVATARWQMAEALSQDLSQSIVVTGKPDDQGRTVVGVVSQTLVQAWSDWLDGVGIRPVAMVPDCVCLTAPPEGLVTAPALIGGDVIVAGAGLSVTVQADLLEAFSQGQDTIHLSGEQAEQALLQGARHPRLNLLAQGQVATNKRGAWRRVAVLAAAVVASPLVLMLAGAMRDDYAASRALNQGRRLAVEVVPQAASSPDPLVEVETVLAQQATAGGQVPVLAATFAALEPLNGASLQEVDIRGRELRGVLRLGDAGAIEALRTGLEGQGLSLRQCDPVTEDGAVVCNLSVEVVQ